MAPFNYLSNSRKIVSPQHSGKYSSHEGEVVLRVPFSAKAPTLTKNKFAEMLLDLLVVEGPVVAWRRFPDPGSFHIVAEFADASLASRAVTRLNGQPIGVCTHPQVSFVPSMTCIVLTNFRMECTLSS